MDKSMTCPYWTRATKTGPGNCSIGMFGGKPYVGNCDRCQKDGLNDPEKAAAFLADRSSHPDSAPRPTDCCGSALNYI